MSTEAEIHHFSPSLAVWQAYDSKVKADLVSTKLATRSGTYLVDPIPLDEADLEKMLGGETVAGILVTNSNHTRASVAFSRKLKVPIYAHEQAKSAFEGHEIIELSEHNALLPDLKVLPIPGGPSGEIALHYAAEGGTLVFGDALINMGSHGFTFLPPKYCTDARLMRQSLRQVLGCEFERLLFAHGTPIVSQARSRLVELLEQTPI